MLECTDLPPFAKRMREELQIPVFDFNTMINQVAQALNLIELFLSKIILYKNLQAMFKCLKVSKKVGAFSLSDFMLLLLAFHVISVCFRKCIYHRLSNPLST